MENLRDYSNLKTIDKKCHIYYNHIRCEKNENIYISSIIHDDGTMYPKYNLEMDKFLSWKQKYDIYMKYSNELKNNEFIDFNQNFIVTIPNFMKVSRYIQKIVYIDDVVFYFPYPTFPFGHYISLAYQYFYYYSYLKKKHPNIKIIMQDPLRPHANFGRFNTNNEYWFFLKDTLDLKNIIYTNPQTVFVNSGTTYTVYSQMDEAIQFSNECIQYYNNLAELSLSKHKIDIGLKTYPKKLLFLRKSGNTMSNGLLKNREEIVELCKKYGYTDVDQTLYSMEETIYLMNNATHIILESGGAICHLLWTKSIKTICIVWRYEQVNLLPNFYENSNKYFKLIPPSSGNPLERFLIWHNARVIYNKHDQELVDILEGKRNYFIKGHTPSEGVFSNIEEFEQAIQAHE